MTLHSTEYDDDQHPPRRTPEWYPAVHAVMTYTTSGMPLAIACACIAVIKPRSPHANLGVWCNPTAKVLICW